MTDKGLDRKTTVRDRLTGFMNRGVRLKISEDDFCIESEAALDLLCSFCESGNYMADYQFDHAGLVCEIDFKPVLPYKKKKARY